MKKKNTHFAGLIALLFFQFTLTAIAQELPQNQIASVKQYVAGKSYTFKVSAANGAYDLGIEYIAGDPGSKLILTSPHGGMLKPSYMHTRSKDFVATKVDDTDDVESFSGTADTKTLELTVELANEIKRITGLRPHIILNHLHRSKLDANRSISVAAQDDPNAEAAWKAFHQYIEDAKEQISKNGPGLVLDIHGNAHQPQRTEVGLLLKGVDFSATDLNQFTDQSSVRALVRSGKATLAELIKGDYALGTLLNDQVYTATPGRANPLPTDLKVFSDGKYFSGGYNTVRYGSKAGGDISAIQLEFNQDVRINDKTRAGYVQSIAKVIARFMGKYFNN